MKTSQKVQVVRTVTEQLGAEFAALAGTVGDAERLR